MVLVTIGPLLLSLVKFVSYVLPLLPFWVCHYIHLETSILIRQGCSFDLQPSPLLVLLVLLMEVPSLSVRALGQAYLLLLLVLLAIVLGLSRPVVG